MPLVMDLQIKDFRKVNRGLAAFAEKHGVTVDFVCADQMRLWLQDLVSNRVVPVPGSSVQGRRAVSDDIEEILAPIPPGATETTWAKGTGNQVLLRSRTGAVWVGERVTPSEAEREHKRIRNRKGRVAKYRGNRKQDGMTVVGKRHLKQSDYRKYRRKVLAQVGKLKAGWLDALDMMARAAKTHPRYPAWLKKAPVVRGRGKLMHGGNGYVEATNPAPYAEDKFAGFLPSTRMKRHKDIVNAMWLRHERIIKQFNGGG